MAVKEGVPQGKITTFTMDSADSKIYPGIKREDRTFGTVDPNDPAKLVVTTSHPAPYKRAVAQWVCPGAVCPRNSGPIHGFGRRR